MMKKIMIIDGGPRKTFNTAKMIEAFKVGVKEADKIVPTAIIYTMNATEEYQPQMQAMYERNEDIIARFLSKPERIIALNTLQVKNYDRYDMAGFSVGKKDAWHNTHWNSDLQNAHQAGIRMVKYLQ